MKPRLVILSDLWGELKSDWVSKYIELLRPTFDIVYYDCCELGNIDSTDYSETRIHEQFLNGGIDATVNSLLEKEKGYISVLSFSIGGTIAWKAGLKGLNIVTLFAISSTRLRYESSKPNCFIQLFYGDLDKHRPDDTWFKKLGSIDFSIFKNETHDLYMNKNNVIQICDKIISTPFQQM